MIIEVFINLELVSIERLMYAVQNRLCKRFKVDKVNRSIF